MMSKQFPGGLEPKWACGAPRVDLDPYPFTPPSPVRPASSYAENPEIRQGASTCALMTGPKRDSVTTRAREEDDPVEWRLRAWFSQGHRGITATLVFAEAGGHSTS
jgi:hypothetical protein